MKPNELPHEAWYFLYMYHKDVLEELEQHLETIPDKVDNPNDEMSVEQIVRKLKRKNNRLMYTDTLDGVETHRDDLWAISTSELETRIAALNKLRREDMEFAAIQARCDESIRTKLSSDGHAIMFHKQSSVITHEERFKELRAERNQRLSGGKE